MFYSQTTGGFYKEGVHKNIPEDSFEISQEKYLFLMEEQSKGNIISLDTLGGLTATPPAIKDQDYKVLARGIRNTLRERIDKYLLPASTINDTLVTEEQKQTLIQDSLLLAKWPTTEGWPYIGLPVLSDLCQSLITIPIWSYPEQTNIIEE